MKDLKPKNQDENYGLNDEHAGAHCSLNPGLSEQNDNRPIGKWGMMHLRYLKEYRPRIYKEMVSSGELESYISAIDEQAQARMNFLTERMMAIDGVTEDLKRQDWLKWVRQMENIQNRAEENVRSEIIFI